LKLEHAGGQAFQASVLTQNPAVLTIAGQELPNGETPQGLGFYLFFVFISRSVDLRKKEKTKWGVA